MDYPQLKTRMRRPTVIGNGTVQNDFLNGKFCYMHDSFFDRFNRRFDKTLETISIWKFSNTVFCLYYIFKVCFFFPNPVFVFARPRLLVCYHSLV